MAILRALIRFLFLIGFCFFVYIIARMSFLLGEEIFSFAIVALGAIMAVPMALLVFDRGPLNVFVFPKWQYVGMYLAVAAIIIAAYFMGFFNRV